MLLIMKEQYGFIVDQYFKNNEIVIKFGHCKNIYFRITES